MLGVFAWIGVANHDDFKLRFENISYATRATLGNEEADFGDPTPDRHLASNDASLKNWLAYIHDREGTNRPKLVVALRVRRGDPGGLLEYGGAETAREDDRARLLP